MAVLASGMRQRNGHVAALVALRANDIRVFAFKRVFGFAVVELAAGDIAEAGNIVAFRAVDSEFAVMRILMAGSAIGEIQTFEFGIERTIARLANLCAGASTVSRRKRRMAFDAIDLLMLAR